MGISKSSELIRRSLSHATPAAIYAARRISRNVVVHSSVVVNEEDLHVALANPDAITADFSTPQRPAFIQFMAGGDEYFHDYTRGSKDFSPWLKTVRLIEDSDIPKGVYVDTFV